MPRDRTETDDRFQDRVSIPSPRRSYSGDFYRPRWSDLFLMVVFRYYSVFAVLVSVVLLLLSVLQFVYAFQMGVRDLYRPASHKAGLVDAAFTNAEILINPPLASALPTRSTIATNEVPATNALERDTNGRSSSRNHEELMRRKESARQALVFAIHGLEFVILAPICFIIARGLYVYLAVRFVAAGKGNAIFRQKQLRDTEASLIVSKALIMGLLSSLVGVDIVSRILENQELISAGMWVVLSSLAVLGGYYIALEWLARSRERSLSINNPTIPAFEDQKSAR